MYWGSAHHHLAPTPPPSGASFAATYRLPDTENTPVDTDTQRARAAAAEVGLDWQHIPHFDDYIFDICGTLDHEEEVTHTVHQMLAKYREHPLLDEPITAETESICILAAYFHDRGKLGLDQATLYQPSHDLSPQDIEHIRQHPTLGEQLLQSKDIGFFNKTLAALNEKHGWSYPLFAADDKDAVAQIALAVRHHHENFDGTGYPDHLSGKDIPLSARIIAAADRHNALLKRRCYKNEMTAPEALAYVCKLAAKKIGAAHAAALILSAAPSSEQFIFSAQHSAPVTAATILDHNWGGQPHTRFAAKTPHHLRPIGINAPTPAQIL